MEKEKEKDFKLEQTKRLLDAFADLSETEVKAFTDAIVGAATMNRIVAAATRKNSPSEATA